MTKLNLLNVGKKLKETKKTIFTPQDMILMFGATKRAVNGFLSYNSKKDRIIKLKKSLYGLKDEYISPYLIANKAYSPSYISFETALSYYHLIPETVYSITSATTKTSRDWTINETNCLYRTIKQEAYIGYVTKVIEDNQIYMATPEKALADYFYFIYLGKIKTLNDRLNFTLINKKKLKEYLLLFSNKKFLSFSKKYL
jgi:predicted transcriptional regulator of viral defense system